MKKIFLLLFVFGTSFSASDCLAQYTKLHDFSAAIDGRNPYGDLVYDGTFLYGMTSAGGTNNMGTIFKIKPDGSSYSRILYFTGTSNGSFPHGSLIFDGTYLYGMTKEGGANDSGTVFKIKPDGSGYLKLLDFAGSSNGRNPYGSLYYDGTYLYGMTEYGGTGARGTVFKILPDGTGYVKLHDFSATLNGTFPRGSLISDGTFLYGMTRMGGITNLDCSTGCGTIFKIKPDGSGFLKIYDFVETNGSNPFGSLIYDSTYLYGVTYTGGANGDGTIFKIKPDGSGYVRLLDFLFGFAGRGAYGTLAFDGTYLYGMTYQGGHSGTYLGNIYGIRTDGSGFIEPLTFSGPDGGYPQQSLIYEGGCLYGMTETRGANNYGVIFKYCLTTGIDESGDAKLTAVYPNPFSNTLNIKEGTSISLYSYTGKEILHQRTTTGEAVLNTEALAAGLYFLKVDDGKEVRNYKVVKAN
jgi:uncharacterized repeat protein (TIGR03803 family)